MKFTEELVNLELILREKQNNAFLLEIKGNYKMINTLL